MHFPLPEEVLDVDIYWGIIMYTEWTGAISIKINPFSDITAILVFKINFFCWCISNSSPGIGSNWIFHEWDDCAGL